MADLAPPLPSLPFFTPYPSRRTRTVHAVPAQLRLQPQLCDRLTRLPRRRHTHPASTSADTPRSAIALLLLEV